MKKDEMLAMIGKSVHNEVLLRAIIEKLYEKEKKK